MMQLSDEIIKVLEYLSEKLGVTIDWTSENVMPFIEQLCRKYISWEIATSIAWIVIALIGAIICGIVFYKIEKCDSEGFFLIEIVAFTLGIICIFVLGVEIFDLIKCITFPELKIFEYIKSLMNQYGGR